MPSSDLAGMLLPAIPVSPVGIWGTLSSSDSDPAGQDGPHVTGGPVGHLGTLSPSTSKSGILVDPGGSWWDISLIRPCWKEGSGSSGGVGSSEGPCWPCDVVGNVTSGCGCAMTVPDRWSVAGGGCSASGHVGSVVALSPVEELKGTGADVVRTSLAVRGVWSGPDVAGTSAVVARVGMEALLVLHRIVQSSAQPGMVVVIVRWWMTG